jgi:1-acyl-sn-glycerol-3-phosphate acyltransferase
MRSLLDDVRELSRGWRWGRRPLTPRDAEPYAPPKPEWVFPTAWARTAPATAAREAILRFAMRPLIESELSLRVHGRDALEGVRMPVLFVSNHTSHLDATIIMSTLPPPWQRRTAVGAAKDYFFDVWWRQAFTALVFGAFPIDRAGGTGAAMGAGGPAAATARALLEDGWNIVVFPEGGRSPDGWAQRFRHGAARLAVELRVPVVPVGIRGAYVAMPKGRFWPTAGRPPVSVRYGRPLHPREGESHRELSRRMAQAVAQLHDEDRTTWWEALHRAQRGETPTLAGPPGPRWLRTWEGSRALPRRGRKPTWR